jgi:hypothetical protein
MERTRGGFDLAYGCFLVGGIGALIINGLIAFPLPIPIEPNTAGLVGLLVLISLALLWLGALSLGAVLTGLLWRDWGLATLSGLSVLFLASAAAAAEADVVAFFGIVPAVYGLSVVAIAGLWFLKRRGKRFPQPLLANLERQL